MKHSRILTLLLFLFFCVLTLVITKEMEEAAFTNHPIRDFESNQVEMKDSLNHNPFITNL